MNRESNLGVTEAGLGLTLVICLLLVVGYVILHYLGGARQAPAVEVRPRLAAEPVPTSAVAEEDDEQPHVLTIESSDAPAGQALRRSVGSERR